MHNVARSPAIQLQNRRFDYATIWPMSQVAHLALDLDTAPVLEGVVEHQMVACSFANLDAAWRRGGWSVNMCGRMCDGASAGCV